MPSLPTLGQKPWQQQLEDFLYVGHNTDGTNKGGGGGGGAGGEIEIGYDQITTSVTVNSTSEAAGTTVISCAPHTFDGGPVMVEFYTPLGSAAAGVLAALFISLFEGSTQIGRVAVWQGVTTAGNVDTPGIGRLRFTPSAGSHTYTVTAYQSGGAGIIIAGATGTGAYVPAFVRFTKVLSPVPSEIDYVERTTVLTPAATTDATAEAFITGNPVTYDGTTKISIEVFCPYASNNTTNQNTLMNLYDGSTDLGRICNICNVGGAGLFAVFSGKRFLTPSAGSHTYSVRAWKTGGTATIGAGTGAAGNYVPAYMRIARN